MAELQREVAITRVAFLELKDEQRLVREGYDLLEEKRILLATEIRRQLTRLRELRSESRRFEQTALEAVQAALHVHGLDELAVYAPMSTADDRLRFQRSRLLGLELIRVHWQPAPAPAREQEVHPSPEARACALVYRDWLAVITELAACSLNLRRLLREYVRTERRARAIENVLLPEIQSALKLIEEQLESLDQEETARLRRSALKRSAGDSAHEASP